MTVYEQHVDDVGRSRRAEATSAAVAAGEDGDPLPSHAGPRRPETVSVTSGAHRVPGA